MMYINTFHTPQGFLDFLHNSPELEEQTQYEQAIAQRHQHEKKYQLDGYCKVCAKPTLFLVDRISSYQQTAQGVIIPNWRERLLCQHCQLNNRQRAILHQIRDKLLPRIRSTAQLRIYAMEQVTPFFRALTSLFPTVECIGSEYINPDHIVTEINGIRHEDAEALSFPDGSIDLITSNDVLEHVNNPIQALREIFRVLKPGGVVFITIPFHAYRFGTVRRAELINGELIYYYPPIYHGNPLSEDGSLVFNDFGLDFLTKLQDIGFHDVSLCLYWSCLYGYLGAPLSYFYARRA